jgi:3-hydroxyisobutyrate dehydrogenase-like beta-hydroxyacid dehydrogenase
MTSSEPSSEPSSGAVPPAAVPRAAVPRAAVPSAAVPSAAVPSAAVPSAAVPSAGVIGLGDIGRGLAENLGRAGVTLSVFDIRAEAAEPFADVAHLATSPADLAGRCDVILVAVVNDAQVRSVLEGDDGVFSGARPGSTVVIVSTISTATVRALHSDGVTHGVSIVDCGVSGGPSAAASGELVCMVGGSPEDVERVRPLLDVISCLVLHMGPHGAGLSAKLARNLVQYGSWLAAFEAQELAEAAGIDLLKLGQAIKESDKRIGGASTLMFRTTAAPWPPDADPGIVGAMRAGSLLAHKDLVAARALGEELGVPLPLAALTEQRCDDIFGLGAADGQ